MSAGSKLFLTKSQIRQIEQEGQAAYPNECCGAILGADITGTDGIQRIVKRLEPLKNSFSQGEQYHRFSLDPAELMRLEKQSSEWKLTVQGFYHSHPDHPARPSEYDRQYAWPYYSYVIVSIMNRKPADMTSWLLDETTEQFGEQPISTESR